MLPQAACCSTNDASDSLPVANLTTMLAVPFASVTHAVCLAAPPAKVGDSHLSRSNCPLTSKLQRLQVSRN